MNNRLTAGVVGCGMGGRLSINALGNSDYFDLAAVADLNPEAYKTIEKNIPGIKTFTNHADMFKACRTDVVCVSTYPPSHEPITMAALNLPLKGILVEKPLGHTSASGRNILNAVKEKNIPMAVPHGLLAKKTPLEIISRVENGEIGDLKLVEIQCTKWDIINAGIHWLNFAVNLTNMEPVDYVMAICESGTRTFRDGMQVETTGVTYIQTESGIRIVMNTGDDVRISRKGKEALFRIIGTKGQIEFWGWEASYILLNSDYPQGKIFTPEEFKVSGHQRHLENMAVMIEKGEIDYSIPESSLLALELCEAAYLSSRHKCKVKLPIDKFNPPEGTDWDPGIPYSGKGGGRDGRKL